MFQIPIPSSSSFDTGRCTKTAFIEIGFFVWCTLTAQIVLNTRCGIIPPLTCAILHLIPYLLTGLRRIYAITMKNTIITGFFVCITVPQLALGIYLTTLAANTPGTVSVSEGLCALGGNYRC